MKRSKKDIGYILVQLALFALYIFRIPTLDFEINIAVKVAGFVFFIAGLIVLATAFIALNKNLTAFPTPKANASLITSGIYHYARHPIYSGVLLMTCGYGVFSANTLRLIVTIMLLILFVFKAAYEERMLNIKFRGYEAYKTNTARFFPGIY